VYLVLGIAGLAIDALLEKVPAVGGWRRVIQGAFCLFLVVAQFTEMYPELRRFKDVSVEQAAYVQTPNSQLDAAVASSSEIDFVPGVDGAGLAPWPFVTYYAIKHKVPIYSYHWLGRFDGDEVRKRRDSSMA